MSLDLPPPPQLLSLDQTNGKELTVFIDFVFLLRLIILATRQEGRRFGWPYYKNVSNDEHSSRTYVFAIKFASPTISNWHLSVPGAKDIADQHGFLGVGFYCHFSVFSGGG